MILTMASAISRIGPTPTRQASNSIHYYRYEFKPPTIEQQKYSKFDSIKYKIRNFLAN
jgi:hypothetical protein